MAIAPVVAAAVVPDSAMSLLILILGSATFGSLLTIAVTWLKEWHTERGKRRADLQREIFFEAATSIRETSRSLQRLSNPQIPMATPEESMSGPSGGWLEKLYLIATGNTLKALALRDKEAALAHFKLSPLRFAITELDQRISKQQARLEQISQGRAEITSLATEAQRRNVTDPAFYQYAHQTFQEFLDEERSVNESLSKFWERRNDIHHRLITEGFDAFVTQRTLERRALLEMRKEMDVGATLDSSAFQAMDDADTEVRKIITEFFTSFISQMEKLVEEDVTDDVSTISKAQQLEGPQQPTGSQLDAAPDAARSLLHL